MVQIIPANERPGFSTGLARGLAKSMPEVLGKLGDEQTLKRREDRQLQQKLGLQEKELERGKQRGSELSKSLLGMPETEIDPALKMVGKYIEQTGDFTGGMEVYKNMSAVRAAQAKANKPAGGVTAQPVPPEFTQKISQIVEENPEASASELGIKFMQAGIPSIHTSSQLESRRREQEARQKTKDIKTTSQIKRDEDLVTKADEIRQNMPTLEASLNSMEDAINSGKTGFFSFNNLENLFPKMTLFTDAKGGQFRTASKNFLIKNVAAFGARPNQYIEQQIESSLAKLGRGKEANLASLALTRFENDVQNKWLQTVDELEAQGNYSPGSLGREVNTRMKDYVEYRQKELGHYLKSLEKGGSQQPKAQTKPTQEKESPKKQLTREMALKFREQAGGDKEKARQLARDAGYDF